ncbi:hypothetical protein D9M69_662110 [compost metagenome]
MELIHPTSRAAELRLGTALVGASLLAIPNNPVIVVSPAGMDDRQQAGSYRFCTLAICGSDSTIPGPHARPWWIDGADPPYVPAGLALV